MRNAFKSLVGIPEIENMVNVAVDKRKLLK
jgi:hypothetical protein